MGKRHDHPKISFSGYLLLNIVVLSTIVATYFASVYYGKANTFLSTGLFPVLATCYVAFLAVSIFDSFWEKNVPKRSDSPSANKGEARNSREGTRKSEAP